MNRFNQILLFLFVDTFERKPDIKYPKKFFKTGKTKKIT